MAKMIALRDHEYGTRRMRAGQLYETFSESDAYWLAMTLAARKASEDETGEEMESLRTLYETKTQKHADKRWGLARLRKAVGE
jgi:hypothetical protein